MKVKEKIAQEYAEYLCGKENRASYEAAKIDFIAGFDKALEIAADELKGGTGDAAGLDEIIIKLGEEETLNFPTHSDIKTEEDLT
jgi:hypothetical protein